MKQAVLTIGITNRASPIWVEGTVSDQKKRP